MKIIIGILLILAGLALFYWLFSVDLGYIYGALCGSLGGLLVGMGWYILKRNI